MGKENSYQAGLNAELFVQKKLWSYGYSVEKTPPNYPFDLLVNGKYKVEVKSGSYKTKKNNKLYWHIDSPTKFHIYNILAVVIKYPLNKKLIFYISKNNVKKVLGDKQQVMITDEKLSTMKDLKFSPLELLGSPKDKEKLTVKDLNIKITTLKIDTEQLTRILRYRHQKKNSYNDIAKIENMRLSRVRYLCATYQLKDNKKEGEL